jgi:hypothetical protein
MPCQMLFITALAKINCHGSLQSWLLVAFRLPLLLERTDRTLLVVSRETGKHLPRHQVLNQSLVLGVRWLNLQPAPQRYRDLGVFHAQNHSSLQHVPASPEQLPPLDRHIFIHS